MFNNVKVVAIIMLIVGGVVGYAGATAINNNATQLETASHRSVAELEAENAALRNENAHLQAEIDELANESSAPERVNPIHPEYKWGVKNEKKRGPTGF